MAHLLRRTAAATLAAAVLFHCPNPVRGQSVPAIDTRITYILPQWLQFLNATPDEVKAQADILHARIGADGPRVKLGFTTYITIDMSPVDPADTTAVQAAIAGTVEEIDAAITRARYAGIPVCLSFATAIRGRYDSAESAAEAADRRTMQWHADNSLASGWVNHSRYSRQMLALQEAFVREIGKVLAARMLAYPDTIVAASGDGEVELAYDMTSVGGYSGTEQLADYSPFAIAEFRDWLRGDGLYAPGQALYGEAWANSARYYGDAAPNVDTNGDGHTLNSDYGTSFTDWGLKHFDWSLSDSTTTDPRAIPSSVYSAAGWQALPSEIPYGFDAPRTRSDTDPWWKLWDQFRQQLVWRHNLAFAKWMTTSADPASGATVPANRWFSDQIPADYIFGGTPSNPPYRLVTSASPYWTADVSPYGSLGITSFNVNGGGGVFYKTLAGVAPKIAARNVRWGVFEWNPSVPATTSSTPYDQEMALIEQYRPKVIAPWSWDKANSPILDTPFETALKSLVSRISVLPLTLNRSVVYASTTTDGAYRSPSQLVRVSGAPGETPSWSVGTTSPFLDVAKSADGRSFTVALKQQAYNAGSILATVVVSSGEPGYSSTTLTVNVTVKSTGTTAVPVGSFDTPNEGATVFGEVGITGWAVDDVGIAAVDIYRTPLTGEPTQANGLVFLGTANLVEGARPDIQSTYGSTPLSERAGWGYMLLTNMLPNAGNGTYMLWAYARDYDGHTVSLSDKGRTIKGQNSTASVPFGTIDTPAQGQTISGTDFVVFGWALTQQPKSIPTDGSTIDIYIDNGFVGHPVYNNYRPDIAALFPGYANTNGAVGYYHLDTTKLSNSVHTIQWVVRDSAGAAAGMGSRYFTVANP